MVKGDQVLGDKHEHYYGPGTSDRTTLIANYLSGVIAAASHLTLTETDNTDPE